MNKIYTTALTVILCFMAQASAYAVCNSNISITKPDSIYTEHGSGTVTDNVTSLMWKQCTEGLNTTAAPCDTGFITTYTWQMALNKLEAINSSGGFAGHTDWRLPNRNELASLVELQCYNPAINVNLFPNTVSSIAFDLTKFYWTSSQYVSLNATGGESWAYLFFSGSGVVVPKSDTHFIRLVRGGL